MIDPRLEKEDYIGYTDCLWCTRENEYHVTSLNFLLYSVFDVMWWHCRSERKRRHYTEAPETDGAEKSTKDDESGDGEDKKKSTEGGDNGTTSPGAADASADGDAKMENEKDAAKGKRILFSIICTIRIIIMITAVAYLPCSTWLLFVVCFVFIVAAVFVYYCSVAFLFVCFCLLLFFLVFFLLFPRI